MIDVKLLRSVPDYIRKSTLAKGYDTAPIEEAISVDAQLRACIQRDEAIRVALKGGSADIDDQRRKELSELKEQSKDIRSERESLEIRLEKLLQNIPNPALEEVPIGKDEESNVVVRKWGDIPTFTFQPKSHLEIGESLGILDFKSGSKVAGSQFYYLDGDAALLEFALIQFGLKILNDKGFRATITPDLARSEFYLGTGYMPKGNEAQIYEIEGEDLGLIATAEITLAGRHANEIFAEKDLPLKYSGVSHCFRREAGAYGKYSKGLYRVHQFSKLEMFAYCLPTESAKIHQELLAAEEEIWQKLEIPYRVLEMCTGDLGAIAARKYDIEAWMPGRSDYGEVTSTSNCTDYQSRNLNIRARASSGELVYAHMLNGTAIAISRAIIAIFENHQTEDGEVMIPHALRPYMFGKEKISANNI